MNAIIKNSILFPFNILYRISPETDLKILFALKQHYPLHLEEPETYNEKLQWLKLYDRNPLIPLCCDKYLCREYITRCGLQKLLVPLYWEGFDPANIPFEELPEEFVIKVTHGSTFNIICDRSNRMSRQKIIRKCNRWLHTRFIPCYGEWFYGKKKPRVIIEQLLHGDDGRAIKDYKVFCSHGVPFYIRVDSDRFTKHKSDMYDCEWRHLTGHTGYPNSGEKIEKPNCLKELLDYAKIISKPFIHARIDFYIVEQKIYFGEITFTNGAGFDRFSSYDFDLQMGRFISLNKER